jgi:uncharacterized membrane protein
VKAKAAPAPASEADPLLVLELVVSNLLRYGVLLSALTILLGLALLVAHEGLRVFLAFPQSATLQAGVAPGSLIVLLSTVSFAHPAAIIDLGLVILIATPVFRVAASIVAFALERDWLYTWITAFVFAMLMIGFAIGRA